MALDESIVESAALTWFGELGYAIGHGPHLAPGEPAAEWAGWEWRDYTERTGMSLNESIVEAAALEWFGELG
jgi:hypothetical protein